MTMKHPALAAAFVLAIMPMAGQAQVTDPIRSQLDVLAGDWTLTDASGVAGRSHVDIVAPGAMLFERRDIGSDGPLPIWFAFSERVRGWVQLFPGPNGIREFPLLSVAGHWPLVFGSEVALQDGSTARFRLTVSQPTPDRGDRRLEISRDAGATWQTLFVYTYRRSAAAGGH